MISPLILIPVSGPKISVWPEILFEAVIQSKIPTEIFSNAILVIIKNQSNREGILKVFYIDTLQYNVQFCVYFTLKTGAVQ